MNKPSVLFMFACLFLVPSVCAAIDKEAVERLIQTPVEELNPGPVRGLLEVVTGDHRIVYVDETGRFLVVGSILDMENKVNLTDRRMEEIAEVDFESIPLSEAIRSGDGPVRMVLFEDPDCPFSRRLHDELKEVKDVTVYRFLINLPSHPEAYDKSKKIICSEDPAAALDRAMAGDPLDDLSICDTELIDRNKSLSLRIGVRGTPYLVPENGKPIRGYRKAAEIQKIVNDILGVATVEANQEEGESLETTEPQLTDPQEQNPTQPE